MSSISADQLANEVNKILDEYGDTVNEVLEKSAKTTSKNCANEIKAKSDSMFRKYGTGAYAKSWTSKKTSGGIAEGTEYTVYNKKHYRLTHLLEYGHATVNGGFVDGQSHIRPAEENAIKQFEESIKQGVQKS